MKFGILAKRPRAASFTSAKLLGITKSLESGEADWLQLHFVRSDKEWVRDYEDHIHVTWESAIAKPLRRPLSPVEERFGRNVGSLIVTYPRFRFAVDSESSFQKKLLELVRLLTVEHGVYYAFVHQGFRPRRPASVGSDDVFAETLDKFPQTSFDADLLNGVFFKEFVKGAFWANFLNPVQVKRLGGVRKIEDERPASIFEQIGDDRVLLQVGPSPLPEDYEKVANDYQHLRRFLKPILIETPEDKQRFQKSVIGTWRPFGYSATSKKVSSHFAR